MVTYNYRLVYPVIPHAIGVLSEPRINFCSEPNLRIRSCLIIDIQCILSYVLSSMYLYVFHSFIPDIYTCIASVRETYSDALLVYSYGQREMYGEACRKKTHCSRAAIPV